jgi:hypothetical protein
MTLVSHVSHGIEYPDRDYQPHAVVLVPAPLVPEAFVARSTYVVSRLGRAASATWR